MTLRLEISDDAHRALNEAWGQDLSRAALEALSIEGYRTGKLSRHDVQTLLGFQNRWETEEWLGSHGVCMNYSLEDLEADRATLNRVLGPAPLGWSLLPTVRPCTISLKSVMQRFCPHSSAVWSSLHKSPTS